MPLKRRGGDLRSVSGDIEGLKNISAVPLRYGWKIHMGFALVIAGVDDQGLDRRQMRASDTSRPVTVLGRVTSSRQPSDEPRQV